MVIRKLDAQDTLIWKQFRLTALQESPEYFGSSYEEEVERLDHDWEEGLSKNTIFGLFINGCLAGALGFFTLKLLKLRHRGGLFSMYTLPNYRGKGVANALLQHVITYAKDYVSQLHLMCVTTNLNVLKLYQKHGFEIYGTEPRALKIQDKYYDEHLMFLDLTSYS